MKKVYGIKITNAKIFLYHIFNDQIESHRSIPNCSTESPYAKKHALLRAEKLVTNERRFKKIVRQEERTRVMFISSFTNTHGGEITWH